MKKVVLGILTLVAVGFVTVQCSKNTTTTTPLSKVTGTVTTDGTIAAGGAVVSISSSPNQAAVVGTTIADKNGAYSFANLTNGTYYIAAKYNTVNTNLKAEAVGFTFATATETTVVISGKDMPSTNITLSSVPVSTATLTNVTNVQLFIPVNGSKPTGSDSTNKWFNDAIHSRIEFSFPYDSTGIFSGIFETWTFNQMLFDPVTPANTSINVTVDITSVNTGAPTDTVTGTATGRDGINGCIAGDFGIKLMPLPTVTGPGYKKSVLDTSKYFVNYTGNKWYNRPASILNSSNISTFVTTAGSCVAYGDGYKIAGTLTLKGVSLPVELYFHYVFGEHSYKATKSGGTKVWNDSTQTIGLYGKILLPNISSTSSFDVSSPAGANLVSLDLNMVLTNRFYHQ